VTATNNQDPTNANAPTNDPVDLSVQIEALRKKNEELLGEKKKASEKLTKTYQLLGIKDDPNPEEALERVLTQKEKERLEKMTEAERIKEEHEALKRSFGELNEKLASEAKQRKILSLETSVKKVLGESLKADKVDFAYKAIKADLQEDDNGFFVLVDNKRLSAEEYAKKFVDSVPELKAVYVAGGSGGGSPTTLSSAGGRLEQLRKLRRA
jgi:hypothetical protein